VSRGKPVGFLILMSIAIIWFALVIGRRQRDMTAEGRKAFADLKAQAARAIRAPTSGELPLAFAFVGATVLVGTVHSAYVRTMTASSGGGSDGGGGCGGGGGGGGCGGCSG
jgi:hypothetical protein